MKDKKTVKIVEEDVKFSINLSEMGEFLLFYPLARYGETEIIAKGENEEYYCEKNGEIISIKRDIEAEQEFFATVTEMHERFSPFNQQDFFYLGVEDVMKKYWFLDFFQQCEQHNIEVFGFENLTKIKYNPHKISSNYTVSSGIDWFDVDMNISYGNQKVALADIRKAVLKKQNMVRLGDGSLGVIPKDWIEQWAMALKIGKIEGDSIKLSNLHFLLIDNLYAKIDNEEQQKALKAKKEKLHNFKKLKKVKVPQGINATLRSYQKEGLNWLCFLKDFGWGGCLADDMGLGKTIQVLSFFMHLKEKNKRKNHLFLVVAPTTLLFNWQKEIEKFCPEMSYFVHWGNNRVFNKKEWKNYDVILTTYGTLANDIDDVRKVSFDVAVLDESQAIKNPNSMRFKASCLINAKLRLVMTGTPIENNTVELFAQMQFLNPGYLGSLKFFKDEFANAIDKNKDAGQARTLSQMIKPFILRRKKEEVAKDLPEKTEMVLYCEMDEQQKKVYDYFKDEIRTDLLGQIEEEGLNKSRFKVLEGLLRLRQICDSAALLNTKEDYGADSVKVDELIRHVKEKTGQHKILVFSQFLGMLSLVKDRLEQFNIKYAYIDGKTKDREAEVEKFQELPEYRVFLLSIKAGGFGLNLTAADYVYILDPWWNPAVEAQAIDRAHRIGQEKHLFAYKMVCKDTIEEKIIELQNKKKHIADEIISTDQGFVKNLTKEDIRNLLE
jgi:SNF2 family DNA or RNA helicase